MVRKASYLAGLMIFVGASSGMSEKIYNESGGLVVMEAENTESAYDGWDFHASGAAGYPAGAVGGHLEFMRYGPEGWGTPASPLVYKFRINKGGRYTLKFRAHKRLEGNKGDKNNDAFIRMEGDYLPGNPDAPLKALQTDMKLFGGAADAWGVARMLDVSYKKLGLGKGHKKKPAVYDFKAGEIYTFIISGRSVRYNLDRMVFSHEDVEVTMKQLGTLPESGRTPVAVESDCVTNGKIPEGDGTAWARGRWTALSFVPATTAPAITGGAGVNVDGDLNIWHKVTLWINGPVSSETATPNPFTDYRLDVTFKHPATGKRYVVPGYFAADGHAADSGAVSGNQWSCHFRPEVSGVWTYDVSFLKGSRVSISGEGAALKPYHGLKGAFKISDGNPAQAPDLRAEGRLGYVGKHHLQFQGSGKYFLKFGPDSPENFLEYHEFDNTPVKGNKGIRHTFAAHAKHYNNDGELWQGTKGKNILGAVNYISSTGANSISMLLNNIGRLVPDPNNARRPFSGPGDGARVFPYTSQSERVRFDCSKLDQWEMVFDHAEKKGLYLHFKLAEIENARDLDGGLLGDERKIYYREMVARFGHHLALNWNISEEIPVGADTRSEWLKYLEEIDPWRNHRVFHTGPSLDKSKFYNPHLGAPEMTGVSLQTPEAIETENVFNETLLWRNRSAKAGQPWVVACDEQGPGNLGVNQSFELSRKNVLWGNIMAGGGGAEYYSGGSDLRLDDYAHFDPLLKWSDIAVNQFFYREQIPFWKMHNDDALLSNGSGHCLTDGADTYVVYLPKGGTTSIDLPGERKTFDLFWFDPRKGGGLRRGSIHQVHSGSGVSLGEAPGAANEDWALLLRKR
ncbi:DUF5060 domain-containing protein [Pontiellaceae bacterium B12227]|nr:DUF5060 domain-containing protein [Pontiellaceae bacterium B12227]